MFNTSLKACKIHVDLLSYEVHPLLDTDFRNTPREILRRMKNNQPLSLSKPGMSNIPINNRFFNDKFDVLDTAIRFNRNLSNKIKEQQIKMNEENRKLHQEFLDWKKSQVTNSPAPGVDNPPGASAQ